MKIEFTATALEKPADMPLLADLAWRYFDFNSCGWCAALIGECILVTDESGDASENSMVFPDEDSFIEWLTTCAREHLQDAPRDFLIACDMIHPSVATDAVVDAVLAAIRQHTDH